MAASVLPLWILLLAGSLAVYALLVRARAARVDPAAAMAAASLVSLACVTAASVYLSPSW